MRHRERIRKAKALSDVCSDHSPVECLENPMCEISHKQKDFKNVSSGMFLAEIAGTNRNRFMNINS